MKLFPKPFGVAKEIDHMDSWRTNETEKISKENLFKVGDSF